MDSQVVILIAIAVVALIALGAWILLRSRSEAPPIAGEAKDERATTATQVVAAPSLRQRLQRSRSALSAALSGVFAGSSMSDDDWQDIEDALVAADVGPTTAAEIVQRVRSAGPTDGESAREALLATLSSELDRPDRSLALTGRPAVVLVVGVNGTGKTTSIAKLAHALVGEGRSVVLGAADTYRAAADTQLRTWGERVGVDVVSGASGADPASVAFDAYRTARDDGADVVIIDTAGRLHSRTNLMDELGKVVRVLEREAGAIDETLLVLDGTVGQNGIAQAEAFLAAAGVTGIVLTKLDGTSRGGIAIAVERRLDVPVKLIGVGEQMEDLIPFVPADFVDALVAP